MKTEYNKPIITVISFKNDGITTSAEGEFAKVDFDVFFGDF